jgi:two-component system sensor histidine kinase DesK
MITRWWTERSSVLKFDAYARWPLYVISASEFPLLVLALVGQLGVRGWGAALLLLVGLAHTVACVALLRTGINRLLGAERPVTRLLVAAGGLTVLGLVAGSAAFPGYFQTRTGAGHAGFPMAFAMLVLFGGGLTAAVSPLLRAARLLWVVALPVAALGLAQAQVGPSSGESLWAVDYLLWIGTLALLLYRPSLWLLGLVWQIERSRGVEAQLAVAQERLRVARDLHDVLGHNLALIALNSELAAKLVRRGQPGADEYMIAVRRTAQDSMREVREVVGGSRSADLDSELAGARSVLRSAGIGVRVIGDGSGLSGQVQGALGWVVREATTNVIRHSDPENVKIEVDASGGTVVLRIENDGVRAVDGDRPSGSGLAGLRDRLAVLGGELTAEVRPAGRFCVRAELPLPLPSPLPLPPPSPLPLPLSEEMP